MRPSEFADSTELTSGTRSVGLYVYFRATALYHFAMCVSEKFPPRPGVLMAGIYLVMGGRMMIVSMRPAPWLAVWLMELGVHAEMADAVNYGRLDHKWAAGWISDESARSGVVLATWDWVQRELLGSKYGRVFLSRFYPVWGRHIGWIKKPNLERLKLLTRRYRCVPRYDPAVPSLAVDRRVRASSGGVLFPTAALYARLLWALCRLKGRRHPENQDYVMADYVFGISVGRFLGKIRSYREWQYTIRKVQGNPVRSEPGP